MEWIHLSWLLLILSGLAATRSKQPIWKTSSLIWFSLSLGGETKQLVGSQWLAESTSCAQGLLDWFKSPVEALKQTTRKSLQVEVEVEVGESRGGNRTQLPKITISCFSVRSTTGSWVSQFPWEASSKSSLKPRFLCTIMPRYLYDMCVCIYIYIQEVSDFILFLCHFFVSIFILYRPLISLQPFSSSSTISTSKKWGEPLEKWK